MPLFDAKKCAAEVFDSPLRQTLEKYDRKAKIIMITGAVIITFGLCSFTFLEMQWAFAVVFAGIITFGISNNGRRAFFRSVVIPELFERATPDLKYRPDSGITQHKFSSYGLFNNFDRYNSEDKLSGKIGSTAFTAAEVHIEKKHRDKDGKTHYSTIFRGVVFVADFNKHLNSRTVVLPDVAERCFGKLVGNFFQKMNFFDGSLVKLENPEFEKLFSVYSHDQIEARYILTPQMMERLTAMRNKNKSDMRLVFEDDHLVLAIEKSSGWLEPPFFGKFARLQVLEKILFELEEIISIIDDLDLNTRIWTKK